MTHLSKSPREFFETDVSVPRFRSAPGYYKAASAPRT